MNDAQIVESLKSDSTTERKAAEKELFDELKSYIFVGMDKFKLSREDAEECYCDAMYALIDNIRTGKYDSRLSLKNYFYGIFTNKCVDKIRKNTNKENRPNNQINIDDVLDFDFPDIIKNECEGFISEGKYGKMLRLLEVMGDPCKSLLMFKGDGIEYKEIAEKMGYKSAGVVSTTIGRCREKLLAML